MPQSRAGSSLNTALRNGGPLGPVAAQLTYWKLQLQDWWAERGVSQKKERASHA